MPVPVTHDSHSVSVRDSTMGNNTLQQYLWSAVEKMANIYLNIGKVHPVEVRQHLVDLWGILEDGAGCLGQVVQTGITSQCLGKGTDHSHLQQAGRVHDGSRHTNRCEQREDLTRFTLVRIISWGKLDMALVSQPSRLLAKLRMAWVRVPEETDK